MDILFKVIGCFQVGIFEDLFLVCIIWRVIELRVLEDYRFKWWFDSLVDVLELDILILEIFFFFIKFDIVFCDIVYYMYSLFKKGRVELQELFLKFFKWFD